QSLCHFAENGIVHIEERGITQSEVKLRAGGIGIIGASHGNNACYVMLQIRFYFKLNAALFVRRRIYVATSAGAFRAAALDDESRLVAVERKSVVEVLID